MNIFAIKGHKVVCDTFDAGRYDDKEIAKQYLSVGSIYTIDYTNVYDYCTEVYLQEIPNISFNSVFFEDVKDQSKAKDRQHRQYFEYHKK